MKRKIAAAATAALCWATLACAYPDKPVTLVVPFAAGGPTDKVARDLAEALRKPLGGAIVIENLGGAGGTLGAAKVAKAAPDGHTLLLHHVGMATSPALYRSLPFKPLEDFEPLGLVNEVPMTLIGRTTLPAADVAGLRQWLAANAGKVTIAHAGVGSAAHLCALLFQQSLKADLISVPYKGTGPAMVDVIGGQIDLMCDQPPATVPLIAGGKVKGFAVTASKRLAAPALAKLPTLDEAGLQGFNMSNWHGLYAPRGTPKAVLEQLNAALRAALKDPVFLKHEEEVGAVVASDARVGGAGHRQFVEAEIAKWTPVIRAARQYAD